MCLSTFHRQFHLYNCNHHHTCVVKWLFCSFFINYWLHYWLWPTPHTPSCTKNIKKIQENENLFAAINYVWGSWRNLENANVRASKSDVVISVAEGKHFINSSRRTERCWRKKKAGKFMSPLISQNVKTTCIFACKTGTKKSQRISSLSHSRRQIIFHSENIITRHPRSSSLL